MRARGSFSAFIMLLLTLQCHVEHQTVSSHRGETGKKNKIVVCKLVEQTLGCEQI